VQSPCTGRFAISDCPTVLFPAMLMQARRKPAAVACSAAAPSLKHLRSEIQSLLETAEEVRAAASLRQWAIYAGRDACVMPSATIGSSWCAVACVRQQPPTGFAVPNAGPGSGTNWTPG
jgi:hypothetical protein